MQIFEKMFRTILTLGLVSFSIAIPNSNAECNELVCRPPSCRCASTATPGNISLADTPQFVFLTFDDAINSLNYDFYKRALFGRKNPDGCNISATFFVSHDWTQYDLVHDLYIRGHEIASHSITHTNYNLYWSRLQTYDFIHEFGGQKVILSRFANIPEEDISGVRAPFLQMAGDNYFDGLSAIKFTYDCSWPTFSYVNPGLWPYTLDYRSPQDCAISPCPKRAHPGAWVVPMLDWTDNNNVPCSMVDGCTDIPTEAEQVFQFFKRNFDVHYKGNKAPFGVFLHATWFNNNKSFFEAYVMFLDYLETLDDVYMVGIKTAIDWIRNPAPIHSIQWPVCKYNRDSGCTGKKCRLRKDNGEELYMSVCTKKCPKVYPWRNNPLGLRV